MTPRWRGRTRWVVLAAIAVVAVAIGMRLMPTAATPVQAARVRVGPFESWVTTNGVIEPSDERVARSPITGFVKDVRVVDGQRVQQGDRMLTLDVGQQRAELARAREELVKAQENLRVIQAGGGAGEHVQVGIELRRAEAEVARLRQARDATARLVDKQAATRDELQEAELALARAEATRQALAHKQQALAGSAGAELDAARLAMARARELVDLLTAQVAGADVRAPVSGTVYALAARPGSHVGTGDALARVADLRSIHLRAFVDEPDLAAIAKGQPVEVTWSAVPDRTWTGRVERVPRNVVQRGDRMVGEVIAPVSNDDESLIPNLDVDARIRLHSRPRALLVPRQAVRGDRSGRYVFVVRNGSLERRPITVDVASASDYVVRRGLAEGDLVALPGGASLHDGMRVTVSGGAP